MRYARGHLAWGECARSGQKMLYKNMVRDGYYPNLMVHPDWYEPKPPQEELPRVEDPIALWRPSPDISRPDDEGEAAPAVTTLPYT